MRLPSYGRVPVSRPWKSRLSGFMPVISTALAALFLGQSVVTVQVTGIAITLAALAAVTAYNARQPALLRRVVGRVDPEVL